MRVREETKAKVAAVDLGEQGCSASRRCSVGQGNCHNDGECQAGLICFLTVTDVDPPGLDRSSVRSKRNFCTDPSHHSAFLRSPGPQMRGNWSTGFLVGDFCNNKASFL